MKGRGGRRSEQLLDKLKESRGYCKLKNTNTISHSVEKLD
jgi:hypothetical protein